MKKHKRCCPCNQHCSGQTLHGSQDAHGAADGYDIAEPYRRIDDDRVVSAIESIGGRAQEIRTLVDPFQDLETNAK